MGVRYFSFIPWCWVDSSEITGCIAIDVPNYFARRLSVIPRRADDRIPLQHVRILLGIVRQMLRKGVLPVLVFDGPPEHLKRPTNPPLLHTAHSLYRQFLKSSNLSNFEIAEILHSSPAVRSYFVSFHVNDIAVAAGVPTISAPSEAEMYAAALCRDGLVDTVLSNDVDVLLFGSPHVTRQLVLSQNRIERAVLADVFKITDLTLSQLRDLAIMCGCDFYKEGIKGIGYRKGLILLKRHNQLATVLRTLGFSSEEQQPILLAREAFDEADFLTSSPSHFTMNAPLRPALFRLLSPILGESVAERTIAEIVQLWKIFGQKQATLDQWL